MKKLFCIFAMMFVCSMCFCGGGFGDDNENARNFGDAIFGPDSLRI